MLLNTISAYGEYNDESSEMGVEQGYEFDFTLMSNEMREFGAVYISETGKEQTPLSGEDEVCHLIMRVSIACTIDDAIIKHVFKKRGISISFSVDEKYDDELVQLADDLRLGEIAESRTRDDLKDIVSCLSKNQPDKEILLMYGTDYSSYRKIYYGYKIDVFFKGKCIVNKTVKFFKETDETWKVCTNNEDLKKKAELLAEKYNTDDSMILLTNEQIDVIKYAHSENGRQQGIQAVRDMSKYPQMPMVYTKIDIEEKNMSDTPLLDIIKRLK